MRNNVRGPTSALTEFLRESGITPTTIARRVATQDQPEAGPSGTRADGDEAPEQEETEAASPRRRSRASALAGYASDDLDEPESAQDTTAKPAAKKRKLTKAAEAKLKAKEKEKAKKNKGKKGDDNGEESEDDIYNALPKSLWSSPSKPPVGNFENCVKCEKQFTVTKYTIAANPGPGFLCHPCAKSSGTDPFKKPALPRKKKAPADKRSIVNFEERRFPKLVTMCVQLITKYIDDIDALGDIGALNVEAISKALSKNRGLTPKNAHLFYHASNTTLTLYDATNLPSPALTTLAYLNPNLTSLRLDFCGHLDDASMNVISNSLPSLTRIELLGPFLVRTDAWKTFFTTHPMLQSFLITQSPRFDLGCMQSLTQRCDTSLQELRLKEIGNMEDRFLDEIIKIVKKKGRKTQLTLLDLSDPTTSCSEDAVIKLLRAAGASLRTLDLSKHDSLTDKFLDKGLKPYLRVLQSLTLAYLPEPTNEGVAAFFKDWENTPLTILDMSRNHDLGSDALVALLEHSGKSLEVLRVNGWKSVGEEALRMIGKVGVELKKVDVGWCREMDDFVVTEWMQGDEWAAVGCKKLEEIKAWGCNKITEKCPRKPGVSIYGVESHVAI